MPAKVRVATTNEVFDVAAGETILAAALRAGVRLPHECTFGGCGTCRLRLMHGEVRYEEFPLALTEHEHNEGFALACQAYPLGDVVIRPANQSLTFAPSCVTTAQVVKVHPLTDNITQLVLRLPDDTAVTYRPGQYTNLLLPDGSTRSFSMASAGLPDNQIDFHIRQIPCGHFTSNVLPKLKPADTLKIDVPLGTFCYHEDDWRPMILAATGTGIAPIKALLESLLDSPDCPPITLYWGMRTQTDLYLREIIESWRERLYEFNFVPVLSREGEAWRGRRGYVQDAVLEDYSDLSEHAFYLCGAPEMISMAKQAFIKRGAELEYIYSDSFTFQHAALTA